MVLALASFGFAGSCGSKAAHTHSASSADKVEKKDIVETAISAEKFNTLVAAVKAAGLVETLQGDGPFTVFAPTDEAFAKLPEGTVEALLNDKEKLTAILTYHVVPGKVLAEDVVKLDKAATVNGEYIAINTSEDGVMVDNANIIATDILCKNGVIHIIDAVVLPKGKKS
ncbi:MAG: fasciclin domain-containing protein [candidate division Zixibacteria bacterium]|nr:fasciclin domain-containing protein [candidate division Zixibacteria bacterium]